MFSIIRLILLDLGSIQSSLTSQRFPTLSPYVLVVTGMSLTPSPKATLSPKAQMSHNQGTLLEIIQSEHGVLELLFPLPFSPP